MTVTVDLVVRYACGCKETIRTALDLPPEIANRPRTAENDRDTISYIESNYKFEDMICQKRHRYLFADDKRCVGIAEIL